MKQQQEIKPGLTAGDAPRIKELLFDLGMQVKRITATYEEIILQMVAQIDQLEAKKAEAPAALEPGLQKKGRK